MSTADGKDRPVSSEPSPDSDTTSSASSRLFDLRELIAAIFIIFGAVLLVAGLFDNQTEINKAAGVRINLWTGIGMIVVGVVFVVWRLWKPLVKENLEPVDPDTATPGAPPAH